MGAEGRGGGNGVFGRREAWSGGQWVWVCGGSCLPCPPRASPPAAFLFPLRLSLAPALFPSAPPPLPPAPLDLPDPPPRTRTRTPPPSASSPDRPTPRTAPTIYLPPSTHTIHEYEYEYPPDRPGSRRTSPASTFTGSIGRVLVLVLVDRVRGRWKVEGRSWGGAGGERREVGERSERSRRAEGKSAGARRRVGGARGAEGEWKGERRRGRRAPPLPNPTLRSPPLNARISSFAPARTARRADRVALCLVRLGAAGSSVAEDSGSVCDLGQ